MNGGIWRDRHVNSYNNRVTIIRVGTNGGIWRDRHVNSYNKE